LEGTVWVGTGAGAADDVVGAGAVLAELTGRLRATMAPEEPTDNLVVNQSDFNRQAGLHGILGEFLKQ
jgi:hypothetical protein